LKQNKTLLIINKDKTQNTRMEIIPQIDNYLISQIRNLNVIEDQILLNNNLSNILVNNNIYINLNDDDEFYNNFMNIIHTYIINSCDNMYENYVNMYMQWLNNLINEHNYQIQNNIQNNEEIEDQGVIEPLDQETLDMLLEEDCGICYCRMQLIDLTITKCRHVFHSSCLYRAFENSRTCPYCRTNL